MSWVESTFGSAFECGVLKKSQTSKHEDLKGKDQLEGDTCLWSEKYQPKCAEDLAVHKKKVQEVKEWLTSALDRPQSKQKQVQILLLTGPTGCGKTATVCALSNDLHFTIKEWINPITDSHFQTNSLDDEGHPPLYYSSAPRQESQSQMFRNFLREANRYKGIVSKDKGSDSNHCAQLEDRLVVLVEDLPNVFHREPKRFHEVIQSHIHHCIYPMVFIMSDCSPANSNKLFTKQLISNLRITVIQFNPIAPTMMVKALNRIASLEYKTKHSGTFHPPSKELIALLTESSEKDIRSAVNALQFACVKGSTKSLQKSSKGKKRKLSTRSGSGSSMTDFLSAADSEEHKAMINLSAVLGSKDHNMYLFRALGKVLYCKRSTEEVDIRQELSKESLPVHLKRNERNPLDIQPEAVLEHVGLSYDMFTLFLHQNYLDFVEDVESIETASRYLSDADLINRMDWTRDKLSKEVPCSVMVACRGLMFANNLATKSMWRPLHKPAWIDVNKKHLSNCLVGNKLFEDRILDGGFSGSEVLLTEVLPFLNIINIPVNSPAQAHFLQNVIHFPKQRYRPRLYSEKLDEKEGDLEGDEDLHTFDISFSQSVPLSQTHPKEDMDSEMDLIQNFSDNDW